MSPYFVHVGYVLTLCAFVTRDVLWLRGLLVCAQTIVASYALSIGVMNIATWNSVFACINTVWVVQILLSRRAIKLPIDLQPLYDRHFFLLTPQEFLKWWGQGRTEVIHGGRFVSAGTKPDFLYFILDGRVTVNRGELTIADLPAGFFVAEMSVLTGALPTADAVATGDVRVVQWPAAEFIAMRQRNPAMWSKVQAILGRDLVEKLNLNSTRLVPAIA